MAINESALDRVVRVVAGLVLLAVWIFGWLGGAAAVVLGIVGIVLVLTGLSGRCLIYKAIGTCTLRQDHP